MREIALSLLSLFLFWTCSSRAESNTSCEEQALKILKETDKGGYNNYLELPNKKQFTRWIICGLPFYSLVNAVHESTHMIAREKNLYFFSDGRKIPIFENKENFYRPTEISGLFFRSHYVDIYLLGVDVPATSRLEFSFLLEELLAYTRDLETALNLLSIYPQKNTPGIPDGMLSQMKFVETYINIAKEHHSETWEELKKKEVSMTIKSIWKQSEEILEKACTHPEIWTTQARDILDSIYYNSKWTQDLSTIIDQPIVKPLGCERKNLILKN